MALTTFKTRARTVDHLGREQIADCPTAISELWKNSYDAYASTAKIELFKTSTHGDIAVLHDNGHGMSFEDFTERWLTIGTESKASGSTTEPRFRNGMPIRPKLGQKGIGRLSSAKLGPLLLLISKKEGFDPIAALLDWRLFENSYLNLSDIRVAVRSIGNDGLEPLLPSMAEEVLKSVIPDPKTDERAGIILEAWGLFEKDRAEKGLPSMRELIQQDLEALPFEQEHWETWQAVDSHMTPWYRDAGIPTEF